MSNCQIQTGTGKSIRLNTTVVVDAAAYNFNSQATLSEWTEAAAWIPNRTTPSTSDVLVFDNGTTDIDIKVDVTNETIKSIILMPTVDVTFREEGSNGTITRSWKLAKKPTMCSKLRMEISSATIASKC